MCGGLCIAVFEGWSDEVESSICIWICNYSSYYYSEGSNLSFDKITGERFSILLVLCFQDCCKCGIKLLCGELVYLKQLQEL
jgi:hypothetical protein